MKLSKSKRTERDRQIVDLLRETKSNGLFYNTFQEIATAYGISRERVRQISSKAGLPPRNIITKERLAREVEALGNVPCAIEHCNNNVQIIMFPKPHLSRRGRCVDHGRDVVLITCAYCGKVSERESYTVKNGARPNKIRPKPQQRWFCDKICQGKYIGKHFGFTAHPENARKNVKRGLLHGMSLADLAAAAEEE